MGYVLSFSSAVLYNGVPRGFGGSESPGAPLPKGTAFGRVKRKKRKTEKEDQKEKKKEIIISAYLPS